MFLWYHIFVDLFNCFSIFIIYFVLCELFLFCLKCLCCRKWVLEWMTKIVIKRCTHFKEVWHMNSLFVNCWLEFVLLMLSFQFGSPTLENISFNVRIWGDKKILQHAQIFWRLALLDMHTLIFWYHILIFWYALKMKIATYLSFRKFQWVFPHLLF